MRWAAATQRRAAGPVQRIFDVRSPHHAGAVPAGVDKKLIKFDILLCEGMDQVVILQSGQG